MCALDGDLRGTVSTVTEVPDACCCGIQTVADMAFGVVDHKLLVQFSRKTIDARSGQDLVFHAIFNPPCWLDRLNIEAAMSRSLPRVSL